MNFIDMVIDQMARATEKVDRFKLLPEEFPTTEELNRAFNNIISDEEETFNRPQFVTANMDSPYVQAILNIEEV